MEFVPYLSRIVRRIRLRGALSAGLSFRQGSPTFHADTERVARQFVRLAIFNFVKIGGLDKQGRTPGFLLVFKFWQLKKAKYYHNSGCPDSGASGDSRELAARLVSRFERPPA